MNHLKPFRFEHTVHLSEADYLRLHVLHVRWRWRGVLVRVTLALAGVAALFWPYSAPFGGVLLAGVLVSLTGPWMMRRGARSIYAQSEYLHKPLTYGVNQRGLWVHGRGVRSEAPWTQLTVWQLRDGWLLLSASGIPQVYFPVQALQDAGIYDRVLALARTHGVEFGSPEARAHAVGKGFPRANGGTSP